MSGLYGHGWRFISEDTGEEFYEVMDAENSDHKLEVCSLDGFGGLEGLEIAGYNLTWEQVDAFKKVISLAENRYRERK